VRRCAFGSVSLNVFEWAGSRTLYLPAIAATAVSLVLVIIPAMFLGATLSILTQYFAQRLINVGRSVGLLYSIKTLGSARHICETRPNELMTAFSPQECTNYFRYAGYAST
jgi:hypothetical protein